ETTIDNVARLLGLDFDSYLDSTRPYLTTAQLSELASAGFELGAHSDSHPYFNEIGIDEQKEQISLSVQFVRGIGLRCRSFAFPFHDMDVPVTVFRHMTDLGLVLSLGTSEAQIDPINFSFQRFAIDAENSGVSLPNIVKQL